MQSNEIRFAVGEQGDQLSPVWRIWNEKDDVYLIAEFSGESFRISLYASGVWTVDKIDESETELNPDNQIHTWTRPPEFAEGWTFGPHIAVPRMAQVDHAKFDEGQTGEIEWLPKPDENSKATIAAIFAAPEKTLEDIAEISNAGDACIDTYLELENGQKVFVRIRNEPVTEADHSHIDYLQSLAEPWIAANDDDVSGVLVKFIQNAEVPYAYVLKWATPPK